MRIWFNHWFSTAYHLIEMMKKREPERFVFIGTSTNPYAIYGQACDEFYEERHDVPGEEYLRFCLDFCVRHGVDIFVPRHELALIVKNRSRFSEIGVKLLAESDSEMVSALDDKFKTYELINNIMPDRVPECAVANDLAEFEGAVERLRGRGFRVCYKLAVDEGARSFRVVDDGIESVRNLYNKPGNKITMEAARKVLGGYDFKIPVLVMPYLEDEEISVDCLATAKGNIVIPRYKTNKRYSEVVFNRELMEECGLLMDRLKLQMPANIQYKKGNGKLYLLEINTRMSGGLQLSCKASGINIPLLALYKLMGEELEWQYPEELPKKVAHIETPVCLEEAFRPA